MTFGDDDVDVVAAAAGAAVAAAAAVRAVLALDCHAGGQDTGAGELGTVKRGWVVFGNTYPQKLCYWYIF